MNEFATVGHAASSPPSGLAEKHPALARFQEAVAKAGGRAPLGMAWNEQRGWHPRGDVRSASAPSPRSYRAGRTLTLAEAAARQREVAREIRMSEVRADAAAVTSASPLAWRWARLFDSGGQLSSGASVHERTGWALHRLGYIRPPLRVLEQQLARSMR